MIDFPSNPTDGQVFTSGNSSWVWNAAASQWRTSLIALNPKVQRLSGDGTTVQFTLNSTPPNVNFLDVYITGLYQQKNTYTVVGNVLTFSEAPPTGTENIEVEWGSSLDVGVPSDASVTAAKLASGAAVGNLGYTPVNKAGDTMTGLNALLALKKSSAVTGSLYLDYQNSSASEIAYVGYGSSANDKFTVCNTLSDVQLMAGSTVGLAVDTNGIVKMPYKPAFFAYGLPANLVANYGGGAITFANTPLNQSSSWNGSRFTAPVAGTYLMFFDAMYAHRGGDFSIQVWKNGAAVAYNNAYGIDSASNYETWTSSTVSWVGTLAANDYVDFRYGSSSNTSTYLYAGGLYTRCYGYMIG